MAKLARIVKPHALKARGGWLIGLWLRYHHKLPPILVGEMAWRATHAEPWERYHKRDK